MATTFTLEHDFPNISVDLFERYLNHPELIASLSAMPGFKSRDLVDKTDQPDGGTLWRFKVVAGGEIPASVRRVLDEGMLTWHEDARFIPAEHTIRWSIEPLKSAVKGVFEAHGIWKLTPHQYPSGPGTRRLIEGTITVKMPIVGKVVEQFIAGELKKSYSVEPELQRKFYLAMKEREAKA